MTPVRLDLHRTFLVATRDSQETEEADWRRWAGKPKDDLIWAQILLDRVVVVLGEPGMGKSWEFEDHAERDVKAGKTSFFLPLNFIAENKDVALSLDFDRRDAFDEWMTTGGPARFYLDAVDEARLVNDAALLGALRLIVAKLHAHLADASFVISSRIADWQIDAVRDSVDSSIVAPLNHVLSRAKRALHPTSGGGDQPPGAPGAKATEVLETEEEVAPQEVKAYLLAPLSIIEAKRLAAAHGASPANDFWREVEEGDYQRLARRPRDLEWMAKRWMSAEPRSSGSFFELLEYSITQHLSEKNDHYVSTHMLMSQDDLRVGSEALAAASVFCDRP